MKLRLIACRAGFWRLCHKYSDGLKKNPQEIADSIKSDILEKIEVKNGFINFFISKEYLQKQVEEILKKKDKYGSLKIGKDQKVNVEFISANPTGPLHIGNGRGAFLGDVLANIFKKSGYEVTREYYINDMESGMQVTGFRDTITTVSKLPDGVVGTFTPGELPYFSDYLKEKIIIFKNKKPEEIIDIVQKENENFIENELKIKFDNWVSEEKYLYQTNKVKRMIRWLEENHFTYPEDGAEWLKTSKFGEKKDWVVVRKTGEPTYLLSDIAYHKDKIDRGFNKIIDIWGADHQGHVGKIKAALKMFNYKGDLDILITQIVRLKSGLKLSKRKGQIITLKELIDEVSLDVARFFFLTRSPGSHLLFDLDLAKEQSEKNPVFYIQYAHARICSILRKAPGFKFNISDLKLLTHQSELQLVKQLIRFPEIIEDTVKDYQIQRIPQYALDLATSFHQFYRDCQVISENKNLTQTRLGLISATKIVLENTLSLMGISAPEKM